MSTVNSRFKLQIHLHKAFFSDDWFLDSLHKSFLNQTTFDLRKEKLTFLNREPTKTCSGGLSTYIEIWNSTGSLFLEKNKKAQKKKATY